MQIPQLYSERLNGLISFSAPDIVNLRINGLFANCSESLYTPIKLDMSVFRFINHIRSNYANASTEFGYSFAYKVSVGCHTRDKQTVFILLKPDDEIVLKLTNKVIWSWVKRNIQLANSQPILYRHLSDMQYYMGYIDAKYTALINKVCSYNVLGIPAYMEASLPILSNINAIHAKKVKTALKRVFMLSYAMMQFKRPSIPSLTLDNINTMENGE